MGKETVEQSLWMEGRRLSAQVMTDKIKAQFQCRHLHQGRRLWVLQYRWNYSRMKWSDSKDSRYRNCDSTNSLTHNHFWCGKYESKIKWLPVLIFHRMQCYGSTKWRWLILWTSWNPRDQFVERNFQISRCWARRLPLLWTRSFRMSVSRSRKPKRRVGFYPRNSKPYWHFATWRFIRRYRCPTIKSWKQWWRGEKIRHFNYETLSPGTGELKQEQWSRIERAYVALKEEKVHVTSGKKKASIRKVTGAVSVMRVMIIVHQNRQQKPLHPLSHQWHEEEARREKEASEAGVRLAEFFDSRADTIWKALAVRSHLGSIGTVPNVNSIKLNRDAKQGISVCSRIIRLTNNQTKSRKKSFQNGKSDDKGAGYCGNCTSIGFCFCKTQSHQNFRKAWSIGETRGRQFWDQYNSYDSHSQRYVKQVSENIYRNIAWKNTSRSSSSAKSLLYEIWGQISRRDWKTRAMRPRQRKGHRYILFACQWVDYGASTIKLKVREFVVDSTAIMHVVSKRDLN